MRLGWLVCLVGCGPGVPQVQPPKAEVQLATDAPGLETLMRVSVTNGGLWFSDSECAAQFSVGGDLAPAKFPAFAKCLAGLNLQRSAREDSLGDVSVYSYAPGFEVEARITNEVDGPRLAWIGYASRSQPTEPPTVVVEVFEALRASGSPDGPLDPVVAASLSVDPTAKSHSEYAWLKVCIDETGKVTNATSYESTSPAAYKAFVTAALTWSFKPFLMEGEPMPVCSMVRPAYPPGGAPAIEQLPLPLPPAMHTGKPPIVLVEGAKVIEGKRISGEKEIRPDDDTKTEMWEKKLSRIVGHFRLCIDERGKVESVLPLLSTGFAAYDRRILSGIQSWVYSPYKIDDQPVPVCTAVMFIYSQK